MDGFSLLPFLASAVPATGSGPISGFVERHPTVKILALIAGGFGQHISKGYIHFARGFSVLVEFLNTRTRKTPRDPVRLRENKP